MEKEIIDKIDKIMAGEEVELEIFDFIRIKQALRISSFVNNKVHVIQGEALSEMLDELKFIDNKKFIINKNEQLN